MSLTFNIYYKGQNGSAKKFANEMISSGIEEKAISHANELVKMIKMEEK